MDVAEIWKPCPDFETVYRVSNLGRIQRISGAQGTHVGHILKPTVGTGGYLVAGLSVKAETTRVQINRVICRAFHGPAPSEVHQAAHNNGNKQDNRAVNLRWATPKENQADRKVHGTASITGRLPGELNPNVKISADDVLEIRKLCAAGAYQAEAAKRFGITQGAISKIVRGATWKTV